MVKVTCRTNLDDYRGVNWPTEMACRPVIGDRVRDQEGKRELKVCSITHGSSRDYSTPHKMTMVPCLIVELTNSRGGAV